MLKAMHLHEAAVGNESWIKGFLRILEGAVLRLTVVILQDGIQTTYTKGTGVLVV